jgi:hypothetical protein
MRASGSGIYWMRWTYVIDCLVVSKSVSFYQVCPAAVRDEAVMLHSPYDDSRRDSYGPGEILDLDRGCEAAKCA